VAEGLQVGTGIFGIFLQKTDQKLIFCLSKQSNDSLVSRIIDIYIELTKEHLLLLLLVVVFTILLELALLENIFLAHGRHLWSLTFPFSFHIYHSSNITISKFLFFNFASLFFFISNRTLWLSISGSLGILIVVFTLFKPVLTKE